MIKRKIKRNKKSINKTVRSSSEHMMIPTNVNTLQSENLHLLNRQLENKIEQDKEVKNDNQLVVKDDNINRLQNDINSMRSQGEVIFKDVYSKLKSSNLSNIKSKNMNFSNVLRKDTFDDNVDVGTTGGDDSFQNLKTPQTDTTFGDIYDTRDDTPPVTASAVKRKYTKKPKTITELVGGRAKSPRIATNILNAQKLKEAKRIYENEAMIFHDVPLENIMKTTKISEVNRAIKERKKNNI